MNSRQMLEDHARMLQALMRGGVTRGVGARQKGDEDDIQSMLKSQWEMQVRLLRRVLSEPGDPEEQLLTWQERTRAFLDKHPEKGGWSDREGQFWDGEQVLKAIEKLLEEIEAWQMEEEGYAEFDEEE